MFEAYDFNCCKNPLCKNYGDSILSSQAKKKGGYKLTKGKQGIEKYECRYCGLSSNQIISPKSLQVTYQYFYSQSIPYATCPNTDCVNRNINLFESFKKVRRPKSLPYRSIGKYRAVCRQCKSSFYIGSAKNISLTNREMDPIFQTEA